jgi:NMD protein affecting ribosome stability and mRNA decay
MKRQRSKIHSAAQQPRPPRRIPDEPQTPQATDPTVCTHCGALYHDGRWAWVETAPFEAQRALCPSCLRIENDDPAGIVLLQGELDDRLREEIRNLVLNVEQRESASHPLKRLFAVEESNSGLRVRTTDARLARAVGRAVQHAHRGKLEEPVSNEEPVRVRWLQD